MSVDTIKQYLNQKVKIVFKDGSFVNVYKGIIIDSDKDFIVLQIENDSKPKLINKNSINKIELSGGSDNDKM